MFLSLNVSSNHLNYLGYISYRLNKAHPLAVWHQKGAVIEKTNTITHL
ncbi:hypothetical protein PROVRETT_07176 [Providencia rettgeri DSM 1131]|nr:hypothetical protein PROVRETT_07176 [Providencia rettgeri DSM 1131]